MATTWSFPILATPDLRTVNLNVPIISKKRKQEETFIVPDLLVTDHVSVVNPTQIDGLSVVQARVSALNELAIVFWNITNTDIDPLAQDFLLLVSRV